MSLNIGVLGLQGSFIEHLNALEKLENVKGITIKTPEDFKNIDGLIIPGGESTTLIHLLKTFDLMNPLYKWLEKGNPTWGTCAGLILLSKNDTIGKKYLNGIDIVVERNAFGSQLDSFIKSVKISKISIDPIDLVFIRAPIIKEYNQDSVEIILELNDKIVAAKQGNVIVTSFHPELTDNLDFYKYFLKICNEKIDSLA